MLLQKLTFRGAMIALIFLNSAVLSACDGSSINAGVTQRQNRLLTENEAKRLINEKLKPNGASISSFEGVVQQNENESHAQASLNISGYQYTTSESRQDREYSGKAIASFTRYTDGRWVLSRLNIECGSFGCVTWINFN